ncbi:nucleotidyltransferase family protein [Sphingobacterium sp. E70]|uniref:nucleotidyltransferase family protein n=1 Tax=Sphingobacterium sp. E70 TaxID=2853439 RepID=UPI00211BCA09|nr:nucleotidyltransferase family protein [Sphingobacterium sp. E70]
MAPQVQVLQVAAHILKHSLAFGVGLRQFCDLASLYNNYSAELEGERLNQIYNRLGLSRWFTAVHQLLVDNIGLRKEKLPFPVSKTPSSLAIIDEVWTVGNFGFHDTSNMEKIEGDYMLRKNRTATLTKRLLKYFPYVPKEAFWFPFIHFFNGVKDR